MSLIERLRAMARRAPGRGRSPPANVRSTYGELVETIERRAEILGRGSRATCVPLDGRDAVGFLVDLFAARPCGRAGVAHSPSIPASVRALREAQPRAPAAASGLDGLLFLGQRRPGPGRAALGREPGVRRARFRALGGAHGRGPAGDRALPGPDLRVRARSLERSVRRRRGLLLRDAPGPSAGRRESRRDRSPPSERARPAGRAPRLAAEPAGALQRRRRARSGSGRGRRETARRAGAGGIRDDGVGGPRLPAAAEPPEAAGVRRGSGAGPRGGDCVRRRKPGRDGGVRRDPAFGSGRVLRVPLSRGRLAVRRRREGFGRGTSDSSTRRGSFTCAGAWPSRSPPATASSVSRRSRPRWPSIRRCSRRRQRPSSGISGSSSVSREGPLEIDELRVYAEKRLPAFARPRRILAVPALPRTPAGKIDRAEATRWLTEPSSAI